MSAERTNDIENRFSFHPADTDEKRSAHESVRAQCRTLAHAWSGALPEGREKSLAVTKLGEAMMWANAAIARADGRPVSDTRIHSSCKHCHRPIHSDDRGNNFVHTGGPQRGKSRCAVDPYGYNAETQNMECSAACLGSQPTPPSITKVYD